MKLFQVFGIRHHWLKWAETAEEAVQQVLKEEPGADWEFPFEKSVQRKVDLKSAAKDCEEIPLPEGYKLAKVTREKGKFVTAFGPED